MDEARNQLLEKLRLALSENENVCLALVFGSLARDAFRADSDIDVGILFDHTPTLIEEQTLEAQLTRATGRDVDLIRLDQASALLRWQVAKNHVVLVSKPKSRATHFLAVAALEHADMQPLFADARQRLARRLAAGE